LSLESHLGELASQYGYVGVFLLSFIGASSLIIPIPYTAVLLFIGAYSGMDLALLAVVSGLGSALGEVTGYLIGRTARKVVSSERQKRLEALLHILKMRRALAPLLIFVFALTPLPDDLLFLPLGLARYPLLAALIPCFLGKLMMAYLIVYGGRNYNELLISLVGREAGGDLLGATTLLSALALMGVVAAVLMIDWESVLARRLKPPPS
jgi:membrane protein YqaA with SNARE-associated domain